MTELELGPLRFGVVGAGRLGLAIARGLAARDLEVVGVSSHSAEGRERATRLLDVPAHDDALAAADHVDCVILCVPDDALAATVSRLAERPSSASPMHLRVVSTSAAGGLEALAPLRAAGHDTCVLHPVVSVVAQDGDHTPFAGAGAAIGASDEPTRTLAHAIAHALELHPFDIDDDAWTLHGAACTAATTFATMAVALPEELAAEAGLHDGVARAAYGALAAASVDRARRMGAAASLAGPIPRGDAAALARQATAVADRLPVAEVPFSAVASAAVRRAFEAGRIDVATATRLGAALSTLPRPHHGSGE